MANTANYGLTLPAVTDRVDINTINNNTIAIDEILKQNEDAVNCITPQVTTATIDSAALADFYEGTKTGTFDADVLGTATIGVIRAYHLSATDAMQILEAADGSRYTRNYTNGSWTSWT